MMLSNTIGNHMAFNMMMSNTAKIRRGSNMMMSNAIRIHSAFKMMISGGATGGVYQGQGRNQHELMTRAYYELLAEA